MRYQEIIQEENSKPNWYDILNGSAETGWINIHSLKKITGNDHGIIVAINHNELNFLSNDVKDFCKNYLTSRKYYDDTIMYKMFHEMFNAGWVRYRSEGTRGLYITYNIHKLMEISKVIRILANDFYTDFVDVVCLEETDTPIYKRILPPFSLSNIKNCLTEMQNEYKKEVFHEDLNHNTRKIVENMNDAFWNWFGNSKVVDENGNPLKVYHGSKGNIKKFDLRGKTSTGGKAFFFTPDPVFAELYANKGGVENYGGGKIYPVYLRINNMFDNNNSNDLEKLSKAVDEILKKEKEKTPYGAEDFYPYTKEKIFSGIKSGNWNALEHPIIIKALKKSGYDGATISEGPNKNFMVFNANQIKSVFNNGNWSRKNSNISEDLNLNEGYIDVSSMVIEAKLQLYTEIYNIIQNAARTALHHVEYDFKKKNPGEEMDLDFKILDAYHYVIDEYNGRGFSGLYTCIYKSSDILTKIVRKELSKYSTNDTIMISGHAYPLSNIKVIISHHEKSPNQGEMRRKESSGTFFVPDNQRNNEFYSGIKIYIDKTKIEEPYHTAFKYMLYLLSGRENQDNDEIIKESIDFIINIFIETFAHEVDHLIYYIKKQDGNEITNIRAGNKSKFYNQNLDDNDENDYYRYLGSNVEIQGWASGAAAELIKKYIDMGLFNDIEKWNQSIDEIINKIKSGQHFISDSLSTYALYIKKNIDTNHNSFNKKEFKIVWQKFLKLLVQKLLAYKK